MAQSLETFVNKVVSVITADGRNIVGLLKGFDQTINLVLEDTHERVYSDDTGVEQIPLGLYIVRGDNVFVFLSHSCTASFLYVSSEWQCAFF